MALDGGKKSLQKREGLTPLRRLSTRQHPRINCSQLPEAQEIDNQASFFLVSTPLRNATILQQKSERFESRHGTFSLASIDETCEGVREMQQKVSGFCIAGRGIVNKVEAEFRRMALFPRLKRLRPAPISLPQSPASGSDCSSDHNLPTAVLERVAKTGKATITDGNEYRRGRALLQISAGKALVQATAAAVKSPRSATLSPFNTPKNPRRPVDGTPFPRAVFGGLELMKLSRRPV